MRRFGGIFLAALLLSVCLCSCGKKPAPLQTPPTGFVQKSDQGTVTLDIKPWPPKTGKAALAVQVVGGDGNPVNNAKVSAAFSMPDMSMNGPTVNLTSTGKDGIYTGTAVFSMATTWKAVVTVNIPQKEPQTAAFSLKIAY